jgi:hypothetical protein
MAFSWIKENTPSESVFFVNSYPWDGVYKPADGGFWIPYLTGRKIVFPIAQEEYAHDTLLNQTQADYVYIGSGYGNWTPSDMNHKNVSLIYDRQGIYIYRIAK